MQPPENKIFLDRRRNTNDKKKKERGGVKFKETDTNGLQRSKVGAVEDRWNNGGTMSAGQARELSEVGN